MPGQVPYIPFVGSRPLEEPIKERPRAKGSVTGKGARFATGTQAETDQAPGFALRGRPKPALRSIIPDRPSMGTFTHPVDVSRGETGRGRTRTFEYGPGKISIPYGPDPGKVALARFMPSPVPSAFTMEQKSSERLGIILETVGKILSEAQYSGSPQPTDIFPDRFPHSSPADKREAHARGIRPIPKSILDTVMGKLKNVGKITGPTHVHVGDEKREPVDQTGRWDAARGVMVVPATSPMLERG